MLLHLVEFIFLDIDSDLGDVGATPTLARKSRMWLSSQSLKLDVFVVAFEYYRVGIGSDDGSSA